MASKQASKGKQLPTREYKGKVVPLPTGAKYTPTRDALTVRDFAARAYGLTRDTVGWPHRDPVSIWLRDAYPKAQRDNRAQWLLTPAMQRDAFAMLRNATARQAS